MILKHIHIHTAELRIGTVNIWVEIFSRLFFCVNIYIVSLFLKFFLGVFGLQLQRERVQHGTEDMATGRKSMMAVQEAANHTLPTHRKQRDHTGSEAML